VELKCPLCVLPNPQAHAAFSLIPLLYRCICLYWAGGFLKTGIISLVNHIMMSKTLSWLKDTISLISTCSMLKRANEIWQREQKNKKKRRKTSNFASVLNAFLRTCHCSFQAGKDFSTLRDHCMDHTNEWSVLVSRDDPQCHTKIITPTHSAAQNSWRPILQ
jgi:hypothetical protein